MQAHNINRIIETVNHDIEIMNTLILEEERKHKLDFLIFNIEHFIEYKEDIE